MILFSSTASALWRDRRGGALVEFAMILIPLFMIIALIIEGGQLIWQHQVAIKAVRNATRYVSRVPDLVNAGCVIDGAALVDVRELVARIGATGRLDGLVGLLPGLQLEDIRVLPLNVVALDPCIVTVAVESTVEIAMPFAPVLRLFKPSTPDSLSFRVADQARYLGE